MIISFFQNSNFIDISKWMDFCIGTVLTEKNMANILVTSSLSNQYQLELDKIYL